MLRSLLVQLCAVATLGPQPDPCNGREKVGRLQLHPLAWGLFAEPSTVAPEPEFWAKGPLAAACVALLSDLLLLFYLTALDPG